MFIYDENGMVVDFEVHSTCNPAVVDQVREAMLEWYRNLPGQVKVRLGKVGMMQGSEVNLKRIENE